MTHPHKAMLDEFGFAIRHLPKTVPEDIIKEAKELHKELVDNPEANERQIHDAMVRIGKLEFPYRRAYEELSEQVTEDHRLELVLDHLDPGVKEKVKGFLKDGVTLEQLIKSEIFETQFSAEERYQVEDGILHAEDHVKEEMPKRVEENKKAYEAKVEEWKKKEDEMQEKINELRALADKDAKWKDEILDKVKVLEEGWSIAERDPDLEEIKKEIEYFKGAMGEDV